MQTIATEPLDAATFAPFGDVIEAAGAPDMLINAGLCERYHDRARFDFGPNGRAGLSIFNAQPRSLPYRLTMMERHPLGSQAFIPMMLAPFLVLVAPDNGGVPGTPRAFLSVPGQAVNLLRGTWHGVLVPLAAPGLFAVIDRIGAAPNLEESILPAPYTVHQT